MSQKSAEGRRIPTHGIGGEARIIRDARTQQIITMSRYFPTADEGAHHTIFPGVHIKTCAADKMMLSVVDLEPHAVVEEHAHPHEQVGMVLAGRATLFIG